MALSNAIKHLCRAVAVCALAAVAGLDNTPARAGFAYKNYMVRQDGGREILCDPYVVQKKDWVLKIFKLRGEIAQANFPQFLALFKRINPHIRDINTIRPGQHILIPLKVMNRSHLAENPSGVIPVPFLALSKGGTPPPTATTDYRIRRGDCVSKLVASRFGDYGSESYRKGLQKFQKANPSIKNLSLIYVGQRVRLPGTGDTPATTAPKTAAADPPNRTPTGFAPVRTGYDLYHALRENAPEASNAKAGLEQAASVLDAKLLDKGIFYFPRQGREDLAMNMAEIPVMTLSDGRRLLFHPPGLKTDALIDAVRSHWQNARSISLAPGAGMASVLDAVSRTINGSKKQTHVELTADGLAFSVQARWILQLPPSDAKGGEPGHLCITVIDDPSQRTPDPLTRYLADHRVIIRDVVRTPANRIKATPGEKPAPLPPPKPSTVKPDAPRPFVRNLLSAMGYGYAENVTITFPYAGIQVAAVSNLVTSPGGTPLFVDFEDLYGDAVAAIEKSGFRIVQITRQDLPDATVKKLLIALDSDLTENPAIQATDRSADQNTTVVVPGFLVRNDTTEDLLFTDLDLDPAISDFLSGKGIRIIELSRESGPGKRADLDDEEA